MTLSRLLRVLPVLGILVCLDTPGATASPQLIPKDRSSSAGPLSSLPSMSISTSKYLNTSSISIETKATSTASIDILLTASAVPSPAPISHSTSQLLDSRNPDDPVPIDSDFFITSPPHVVCNSVEDINNRGEAGNSDLRAAMKKKVAAGFQFGTQKWNTRKEITRAHIRKRLENCRMCACDPQTGELISTPRSKLPAIRNLRLCTRPDIAKTCADNYGCRCVAYLGQPTLTMDQILQNPSLQPYREAIRSMPQWVRDVPQNRNWAWQVDPLLQERPGHVLSWIETPPQPLAAIRTNPDPSTEGWTDEEIMLVYGPDRLMSPLEQAFSRLTPEANVDPFADDDEDLYTPGPSRPRNRPNSYRKGNPFSGFPRKHFHQRSVDVERDGKLDGTDTVGKIHEEGRREVDYV